MSSFWCCAIDKNHSSFWLLARSIFSVCVLLQIGAIFYKLTIYLLGLKFWIPLCICGIMNWLDSLYGVQSLSRLFILEIPRFWSNNCLWTKTNFANETLFLRSHQLYKRSSKTTGVLEHAKLISSSLIMLIWFLFCLQSSSWSWSIYLVSGNNVSSLSCRVYACTHLFKDLGNLVFDFS